MYVNFYIKLSMKQKIQQSNIQLFLTVLTENALIITVVLYNYIILLKIIR